MIPDSFQRNTVSNKLLHDLFGCTDHAIFAEAKHQHINPRTKLERYGKPVETIHFITSGIVSFIGVTSSGKFAELAPIGNEGMTGLAIVLGGRVASSDCVTRTPCTSLNLPSEVFRNILDKKQSLRNFLLRYVKAYLAAVAANSVAQARGTVDQRLARTLLMCFDRMDERSIAPLTHEALAEMTGARRSSITNAIHKLEAIRAIRSDRGMIAMLDRSMLHSIAGCFYGSAEREYERIMGDAIVAQRSDLPNSSMAEASISHVGR